MQSGQVPFLVNSNPPSEKAQIQLAMQGDSESFECLYRKYSRRVFAICKRMINDESIAEDLVQETFLCAFRRLNTFRGDSLFSTWLHRIAVNAALMHIRRTKIDPCAKSVEIQPADEDDFQRDFFTVRDHRLMNTADRIRLERAVGKLPPGYRIMFILHDIEGYEHSEIASLIGCSAGNTKSQLHKARKRLRQILADEEQPIMRNQDEPTALRAA
jgi:RNA polymerase sigma-70 factor, ECF subfamily